MPSSLPARVAIVTPIPPNRTVQDIFCVTMIYKHVRDIKKKFIFICEINAHKQIAIANRSLV